MDDLFRLPSAVRRDPRIGAWFDLTDPLRALSREWFELMRGCGADVREVLHDGCPTACVGDVAFGYVNAFKAHANVGFFNGAVLADPAGLLEGDGKRMRHVKLRPGKEVDGEALSNLIRAACDDIRRRLSQEGAPEAKKPTGRGAKEEKSAATPSQLIDARVRELADWRGEVLARVRALIKEADPDVVETWKWRGVPVWEHAGIICTGETYKSVVKLTFAKGARLEDPSRLFNASLEGNVRRAIDIHEGDAVNGKALKALISAAVALNTSTQKKSKRA